MTRGRPATPIDTHPASTDDEAARAPRLRLRVEFQNGGRIGPGKIDLVEAVAETGSITAAGRRMGMSYRRAWLLLDALNSMFDEPVVTTSVGGANGGGALVTPFGRALVTAYRDLEVEAAEAAARRMEAFLQKLKAGPAPQPGGDPDA